jgi:predicted short-subunit dehydrogenase-like oxidoreductase (DUF2520 family)
MPPSEPHISSATSITLVGAGRVGGSLERALSGSGHQVKLASRQALDEGLEGAEIALLCVPDRGIAAACESVLAARGDRHPLAYVGHTSGASTLDPLQAARAAGLGTFSVHPLQTIPTAQSSLTGAPAAVAGSDESALRIAESLASDAGMDPFEVPDSARAAYHAAASIASNFLIALEESASKLLERAGISGSRELLAPLVLRTAANWADHGGDALTGPIARGDVVTVERHRAAIAQLAPELEPLYEALAERTRSLAREAARDGSSR